MCGGFEMRLMFERNTSKSFVLGDQSGPWRWSSHLVENHAIL